MKPRIAIKRIWADDDVAQLTFEVCDGTSVFLNEAYAGLDWGTMAAAALARFGHQVHGGLFDLKAGDGGPECASGAFVARFHYYKPTMLLISTVQQAQYMRFKDSQVAAEAKMFMRTEPGLLDVFVKALPVLDKVKEQEVVLECIAL